MKKVRGPERRKPKWEVARTAGKDRRKGAGSEKRGGDETRRGRGDGELPVTTKLPFLLPLL